MQNLLELEACSNSTTSNPISNPLPHLAWEPFLSCMPDQWFASYLRRGMHLGFRIGFKQGSPLRSCKRNHGSVQQLASQVDAYLQEEVVANRLVPVTPAAPIHINPMGLIPKKNAQASSA